MPVRILYRKGISMIIQICIGSSCHIKGSAEMVQLFQKAVTAYHLEDTVTLAGSFCSGRCNRTGVTIRVDDALYTGVTPEGFRDFFDKHVLSKL